MNEAETERLVEENRQLREEIERWKVVCQLYNAGMMEDAARISDLRMTVHREAARTIDELLMIHCPHHHTALQKARTYWPRRLPFSFYRF